VSSTSTHGRDATRPIGPATGGARKEEEQASGLTTRRTRLGVRGTLAALGTVQVVNAAWALLWPTSFYEQFPFGRGWVEVLPAFNEHLIRDVGALYLATAALLLGAAWMMSRGVIALACVSWLMFAIPHAVSICSISGRTRPRCDRKCRRRRQHDGAPRVGALGRRPLAR
jgi:hypothetical protein